jgi:amidase
VGGSWVGASAAQIARAVQRGDTTSTAVIADHVDHARVADRILSVFGVLRDAAALAEAEQVDEQPDLAHLRLAGVPIVVDESTPVAGLSTAERDHEVVRRLRGAGAVVLGVSVSEPTANPWRSDRAAIGAAAAVAAGVVPIAHAADPLVAAAGCGVVGLRPDRDPMTGPVGEHGILATTVADAALATAVLAGGEAQPGTERVPARIAVVGPSAVLPPGADAETREILAQAGRVLVAAGHDTVRAPAPKPMRPAMMTVATWLERRTAAERSRIRRGERVDWRDRCISWLAENRFDLLLAPVIPGPPAAQGRPWRLPAALHPYAGLWSLAGLPAIVVPMGQRRDGLPATVQLVGPPNSEGVLLAAAAQFEAALTWPSHAPSWPRVEPLRG